MNSLETTLLSKVKRFSTDQGSFWNISANENDQQKVNNSEQESSLAIMETDIAFAITSIGKPKQHRHSFYPDATKLSEVPCYFYRQGFCLYGQGCKFSHDPITCGHWLILCEFYALGYCPQGEACPFLHGEHPCVEFHISGCRSHPCRFSHLPLDNDGRKLLNKVLEKRETVLSRNLGSENSLSQPPLWKDHAAQSTFYRSF